MDKKGVMCVIACPLLENELIHSLHTDAQSKRILLADTGPAASIRRKLDAKGVPYELIAEDEFFTGRDGLDRSEYNILILMNPLGLHSKPAVLKETVESQIVRIGNSCDSIALYYGLCGNALWNPSEWAKSVIDVPVHIFHGCDGHICDDCVGVAVSGTANYMKLLKKHTGQLFLIPAMAENWSEFFGEDVSKDAAEMVGMEPAEYIKWFFQLCGYKYACGIDTGLMDHDRFEYFTKDAADHLGLELTSAEGFANMYSTDRMYEECKGALPDRSL